MATLLRRGRHRMGQRSRRREASDRGWTGRPLGAGGISRERQRLRDDGSCGAVRAASSLRGIERVNRNLASAHAAIRAAILMKPRSWPEGGSVDDVQDLLAPSRASAQHGAISRDETSQNAAFIGPLMSVKSASSAHRGGLTSAPNHPPRRTWTDTGSSHPELWSRPELSRLEQGFVDGVGEGRNPGHRRAERRHRRAVAPPEWVATAVVNGAET